MEDAGVTEETHRRGRSAPKQGRSREEEERSNAAEATAVQGDGTRACEWEVRAVATTTQAKEKWGKLIPAWKWSMVDEEDWAIVIIGCGNDIATAIGGGTRTPEWVIVDGGEFHRSSVITLKTRHLKKWGVRGSLSVWGVHVERDHIPRKHTTVEKMMERLQAAVQTRLRKAYNAVGGGRFKPDTREEDFSFAAIAKAIAANPQEVWGEELDREEWAMQSKWE
jgi:hypothetical protein